MYRNRIIVCLLCFLLLITGGIACRVSSPYYQKQVAIPDVAWTYDFQPVFKVKIDDTSANYRMYILFRHDAAFPFSNIWIKMKVKRPGDTAFSNGRRIESTLADPEGKWLGKGINDIWEHKIPVTIDEMPEFDREGIYEIKMEQIMRMNPLPSVLNVGLMIEQRGGKK